MSDIKILSPVVEQYALTVSIPMQTVIIFPKEQNIYEAEASFVAKRDRENDHAKKVEFDRARALLKYAYTCNAVLNGIWYKDQKLKITLVFYTLESLIDFRDTMGSAVSSSTMK